MKGTDVATFHQVQSDRYRCINKNHSKTKALITFKYNNNFFKLNTGKYRIDSDPYFQPET